MNYDFDRLMLLAIAAAVRAGREILKVYKKPFGVEKKKDNSPVTVADRNAHRVINDALAAAFPHIPVLSEEGSDIRYEERKRWDLFWLVDPLDGTKDFIKKNGEFTVNIALVRGAAPLLGVVYIPCSDTIYIGMDGRGAFKVAAVSNYFHRNGQIGEAVSELILGGSAPLPLSMKEKREKLVIVKSRSHSGVETERCIEKLLELYGGSSVIAAGSSIKLCLLAEGSADVYPRIGPTMEWDTAAGHAVLRCSGGDVLRTDNWSPLAYNKEDLRNPSFVAVGSSIEEMKKLLKSICTEGV